MKHLYKQIPNENRCACLMCSKILPFVNAHKDGSECPGKPDIHYSTKKEGFRMMHGWIKNGPEKGCSDIVINACWSTFFDNIGCHEIKDPYLHDLEKEVGFYPALSHPPLKRLCITRIQKTALELGDY